MQVKNGQLNDPLVMATSTARPSHLERCDEPSPDVLRSASPEGRRIRLEFGDARVFDVRVEILELPIDKIDWGSASVGQGGETLRFRDVANDDIAVTAKSLRYRLDPEYAKVVDAELEKLLASDELQVDDQGPPPAWTRDPTPDLSRQAWK